MTVDRRPITAEDRRRAVLAAIRRHGPKRIQITEGIRRAIVSDPEYRRGVRPAAPPGSDWVQRDTATGRFAAMKARGGTFRGVKRER